MRDRCNIEEEEERSGSKKQHGGSVRNEGRRFEEMTHREGGMGYWTAIYSHKYLLSPQKDVKLFQMQKSDKLQKKSTGMKNRDNEQKLVCFFQIMEFQLFIFLFSSQEFSETEKSNRHGLEAMLDIDRF